MQIRPIEIADAEKFLKLINATDEETSFLLYEKGERKTTIEEQTKIISEGIEKGVLTYVLIDKERLVGFVFGNVFTVRRRKHCMYLAIAILQAYTGKGWGEKLMNTIIESALKKGISRFELEVSVNNKKAISLYQKLDFEIEGRRKNSYLIDGVLEDDFLMAKVV